MGCVQLLLHQLLFYNDSSVPIEKKMKETWLYLHAATTCIRLGKMCETKSTHTQHTTLQLKKLIIYTFEVRFGISFLQNSAKKKKKQE